MVRQAMWFLCFYVVQTDFAGTKVGRRTECKKPAFYDGAFFAPGYNV